MHLFRLDKLKNNEENKNKQGRIMK